MSSRIRILVSMPPGDESAWADWQAARLENPDASRMILQRVLRGVESLTQVGLGYGEALRWFNPGTDARGRREIVGYAAAVLARGGFPVVVDPAPLVAAPGQGAPRIILLSHAATDLLSIERARADLPGDFPSVEGRSLLRVDSFEELLVLIGPRTEQLLVVARIHGAADSVTGLNELLALACREHWDLVVISGVGTDAGMLPRTPRVTPELAAALTAYFMAGGRENVSQALRCAAAQMWQVAVDVQPPRTMPAHGLYHPDLLVTGDGEWEAFRKAELPTAIVLFYRAHVLSGNLQFVDVMLRALERRGFAAVGAFTSSLRDRDAQEVPFALRLTKTPPDVIVNTVSFPIPAGREGTAFAALGAPPLHAICCGSPRREWHESARGLSPIEAAMNVALPECDGRIIVVPISFKEDNRYRPDEERIERVAGLAHRIAALRSKNNAEKRIAIVLSNSGSKAQRIGGAVGLDTPASLLRWLNDMREAGYHLGALPESPQALMQQLLARGSYDEKHPLDAALAKRWPRERYARWFEAQSTKFQTDVSEAWGRPKPHGATLPPPFWRGNQQAARRSPLLALIEPHSDQQSYLFAVVEFGNVMIAIQPPRGFGVDPEAVYHAPDLPPCHHYAAFYRWLAEDFGADALIHFGTHGTLEWLPGKSLAMSADCAPDVLLGDMPLLYPFVVNNPGEGAQAKRRTHAVIVDHLVPPLTHAETYGPLATLARMVEEYYRAETLDPQKLPVLRRQIWSLVREANLEDDLRLLRAERHADHIHAWDERLTEEGVPRALEQLSGRGFAHLLEDLDAYLCDLGRAQIRGGLHVFGAAPQGAALRDLLFAITRAPNADVPSFTEALGAACGLDSSVVRDAQGLWPSPVPDALAPWTCSPATCGAVRSAVDELGRALIGDLALQNFSAEAVDPVLSSRSVISGSPDAQGLGRVLRFMCDTVAPNLERTTDETRGLLAGLEGRFVSAGPAGSPSRGMAHVLPTGRNFYAVDPRGMPTPAAWATGSALATEALARHLREKQHWPESIALSVWGTPTMRTGGDDICQALAFLGVRPVWDAETRRTTGFEVIELQELARPRIDVTLRVSGFFRDAFPALMHLIDAAVQRVAGLEEPLELNFVRKHSLSETESLIRQGCDPPSARRRASYRVFSSKAGAYGAGLMQLMDSSVWRDGGDLADAVVVWGGWAYSPESPDGVEAMEEFRRKLAGVDLVLHNQDNLEQDLFDSGDYFEFHGGLVAAAASFAQSMPEAYCGDSSNPERPIVRTLQGEALRVYRSRVVNPKWLNAIQRHGYRGGLEMAATVDSLFGFAATTGIVADWMFDGLAESFAAGGAEQFLRRENPWAWNAILERLLEAQQRELWAAKPETLERLRGALLESEASLEGATEHLV